MRSEIERVASYADKVLPLATAHLRDDFFYQSLPLCVIDAVYSIGVKYTGVQRVVERYCAFYELRKTRENPSQVPRRAEQESISAFCEKFEQRGLDFFASTVFRNRQRTSTRNGILKADAVYRFASVLRSRAVEHLQDVPSASENMALERDIRAIPGQASGISLQYLWMLTGADDFIKPDRMILRFLQQALGRPVGVSEAPGVLRAVTEHLSSEYPTLTPRVLDHEIWKFQRAQSPPSGEAASRGTAVPLASRTLAGDGPGRYALLDPDVSSKFDTDAAVNRALREWAAHRAEKSNAG